MSDYGLVVKNNNSEIQVDSTYRNLSLDEEDDLVTITNNYQSEPTSYDTVVSIVNSALTPIILMRPDTDYYVAISSYYKSGSLFTGFGVNTQAAEPFNTPITTDIDWKSYRENRVASGDDYGLLVYNPSGFLCFDSGKNYFKIHSVNTINLAVGDSTTITHSGISDPFYILSPSAYWVFSIPLGGSEHVVIFNRIGIKKISSTSVSVGWFAFGRYEVNQQNLNVNEGINPTMKLIVCDAT